MILAGISGREHGSGSKRSFPIRKRANANSMAGGLRTLGGISLKSQSCDCSGRMATVVVFGGGGFLGRRKNSIWACREPRAKRARALDPNAIIGIKPQITLLPANVMPATLRRRDLRSLAPPGRRPRTRQTLFRWLFRSAGAWWNHAPFFLVLLKAVASSCHRSSPCQSKKTMVCRGRR